MGYCNYNKPSVVLEKELKEQISDFNSGPQLQGPKAKETMEKVKRDYDQAIKLLESKGL